VLDRVTGENCSGRNRPKEATMTANADPRALALFTRFVRLNPGIAEDDPVIARTFEAYMQMDDDSKALIVVGWHRG
jgi:hypothetical protein